MLSKSLVHFLSVTPCHAFSIDFDCNLSAQYYKDHGITGDI